MAALLTDGVVGREQELSSVDAVLSAMGRGEFQALVVHGQAGIGKTRLLSELAHRASALDAHVCWGSATEFERHVPFAVYRDAFAGVADVTGTDPFQDMDRYRLFQHVRGLLKELAATRPTVLVLDDLHWADPSAVELTGYLLRRPPAGGLLIAVAYRPTPAPPGVADAAFHLGPAATVIGLRPLTTADVDVLLPGESERRRRLLYLGSGGNPLYLRALAGAGDETLAQLAGTGDGQAAPERALLDVFCAELDRLDQELQHVARAAAVAGDPAALDLVAWIAERSEPQVASAVDDLDRLGVLTTAVDSGLRFQHPLVRTAAYWRAGGGWRSRAHARAAEFLRIRHGPLQVVAHHTERSAHPGDAPAASILAEAGTACLHTAPTTAARLLRAALRIMPEAPELAGRRVDLQLALARAVGMTGQLAESRSLLQEVIRIDGRRRVEAVTFASVVCRLLGQFDEAKALLAGELARCRDDGRAAAHALVELVAIELARNDPVSAQRYGHRALPNGGPTFTTTVKTQARDSDGGLMHVLHTDSTYKEYNTGKVQFQTCSVGGDGGTGIDNLACGALAAASSTYAWEGYSPARATDCDNNTSLGGPHSWANSAGVYPPTNPQWLQVDLGVNKTFSRMVLYTSQGYPIRDFDVQVWNGSTFVTVGGTRGNTNTSVEIRFGAQTTRLVRVIAIHGPNHQPGFVRVNEVELYTA